MARLLTLEEIKALTKDTDVYIEQSGYFLPDIVYAATVEEIGDRFLALWHSELVIFKNHGKKPFGWRCWIGRPTDSERNAVAWTKRSAEEG